jgi:hypothetical protein
MVLVQMLWSLGAASAAIYCFCRAGSTWCATLARRTAREEFFYRYFRWHFMLLRLTSGLAWLASACLVWQSFGQALQAVIVVGLIWIVSIPAAWLVMGTLYAQKFGKRH